MNARQQNLFDTAVKGHQGGIWQLRLPVIVSAIASTIDIPDTGNWNDDFAWTLDEVERQARKSGVRALEVISDHQEKTGANDYKMIDQIIAHYDRSDKRMMELFEMFESIRKHEATVAPPTTQS